MVSALSDIRMVGNTISVLFPTTRKLLTRLTDLLMSDNFSAQLKNLFVTTLSSGLGKYLHVLGVWMSVEGVRSSHYS